MPDIQVSNARRVGFTSGLTRFDRGCLIGLGLVPLAVLLYMAAHAAYYEPVAHPPVGTPEADVVRMFGEPLSAKCEIPGGRYRMLFSVHEGVPWEDPVIVIVDLDAQGRVLYSDVAVR